MTFLIRKQATGPSPFAFSLTTLSLTALSLTAFVASSLHATPYLGGGAAPRSHRPAAAAPQHPAGPKVGGPLNPGGPTFGYGAAADLHTVEHGWRIIQGRPGRYVYLKVHNNSRKTWRGIIAILGVYNRQGVFLRKEPNAFGQPLGPGQTCDKTFGPVGPQDQAYTIIGYQGHL